MSKKVTINILGVEDELILKSMEVLNQIFFASSEIFKCDHADLTFHFQEFIQENTITITGTLNDRQQILKREFEQNSAKTRKYAYLAVYLLLLQQETNEEQSWGLLNGMRPTKLVHALKKRRYHDQDIKKYLQETYLVSDEKMNLLLKIAEHQLRVVPDLYELEKEVSLYIGIPFCPTKCAYCTFAAYAYEPFKKWVNPFLETLIKEIEAVGAYIKDRNISVTSIYFGGGTATTLTVFQLEKLITTVYQAVANSEEVREITVEAGRPDTITPEKLNLLKRFNIKRISINPQSFNQDTLDRIGRHHEVNDVVEKFHLAKKCDIQNVNMDLIIGLPGEAEPELLTSLEQIKLLQPESLTVHMLAFKRKSKMTRERGLYPTVSKKNLQKMGQMTYEFAIQEHYIPYYLYRQKNTATNMENIGYSKLGQESIYNITMMEEAQNILGLGVGASSKYLIGTSVHNPKDLKTYVNSAELYIEKKLRLLEETMFPKNGEPSKAFVNTDIK